MEWVMRKEGRVSKREKGLGVLGECRKKVGPGKLNDRSCEE